MQRVHVIGIAGVGMSAAALLMKEAGWRVTGSDAESYGPPKALLERAGISFSVGYRPENIPPDTDCFVIGRNAKLAPAENAEVRAAHASGKPIYSFPEVLGMLTEGRKNLVVAGSYGKSTTTALAAHLLRHAGVDVGYFIGAEPVRSAWLPAPAALGSAPLFVLEGDEYPSAHDDPRAKFLHLSPTDVLLTSVVHDHVNVYPSFEAYQAPFRELLALVPAHGLVVACADEPGAHSLAEASGARVVTYGLSEGTYRATDIVLGARSRFTLQKDGVSLGSFETTLLGRHNIEDIVGASAYALARGLLSPDALKAAIRDFPGVRRRLDDLAPGARVPVFEGFGSSYEKARAALEAIRAHFPTRPLVVVFEPHTFGWRNRANLPWYDDVFRGATQVYVAPPETQGAGTHDQLSHEEILARIGTSALPYEEPEQVVRALSDESVVLILTSGSLGGTIAPLAARVASAFPR